MRFADAPVDLTREEFRAALQRSYDLGAARTRADLRHRARWPLRAAVIVAAIAAPAYMVAVLLVEFFK